MASMESESDTMTGWVEEMMWSGPRALILYPRGLSIASADDPKTWHWQWLLLESQGHKMVEVPKLIETNKLEISGKIPMSKLDKIQYEVSLVVMLNNPTGEEYWKSPLTLKLELPDRTSYSHDVMLDKEHNNRWLTLVVGEFFATGSGAGEVKFSLFDAKNPSSKTGLIVKCAVVHPLFHCGCPH